MNRLCQGPLIVGTSEIRWKTPQPGAHRLYQHARSERIEPNTNDRSSGFLVGEQPVTAELPT